MTDEENLKRLAEHTKAVSYGFYAEFEFGEWVLCLKRDANEDMRAKLEALEQPYWDRVYPTYDEALDDAVAMLKEVGGFDECERCPGAAE